MQKGISNFYWSDDMIGGLCSPKCFVSSVTGNVAGSLELVQRLLFNGASSPSCSSRYFQSFHLSGTYSVQLKITIKIKPKSANPLEVIRMMIARWCNLGKQDVAAAHNIDHQLPLPTTQISLERP